MVEEPIFLQRALAEKGARDMSPALVPQVTFDRPELGRILTVYGRMVACGEWRDYALDFLEEVAVFSIFRHTSEMPLLRIEAFEVAPAHEYLAAHFQYRRRRAL